MTHDMVVGLISIFSNVNICFLVLLIKSEVLGPAILHNELQNSRRIKYLQETVPETEES